MEIAIGIVGLLIAWFTYQKTFLSKPKEEIENFLLHFRSTQSMSKKVQTKLKEYAEMNNAWDKDMFPNITFAKYIDTMKESYEKNLSDKLIKDILNEKSSKSIIISMTKSLEAQLEALNILDAQINLISQKEK